MTHMSSNQKVPAQLDEAKKNRKIELRRALYPKRRELSILTQAQMVHIMVLMSKLLLGNRDCTGESPGKSVIYTWQVIDEHVSKMCL